MRHFRAAVVLSAVLASSVGTLDRLTAETELPVGGTVTTPGQGGQAATALDRVRALMTRQQAPAQSQKGSAKSTATIQTDMVDYPPDAQVNVTGSGWLPGEVVELTFTETETMPPGGYTDGPFTFYATADGEGNIANGDFRTDHHDVGVTFVLTAKGVISGRTAQTTFRDGTLAGFFEIDGNTATTTSHDWSQVYSDFKGTTASASGTGAINFFNDAVPVAVSGVGTLTEDTFSGGASKDTLDMNGWQFNSSAPQNKGNLENAIGAAYIDPANGHTYLYVGADRYDATGGAVTLGVWFLQTPIVKHSDGKFYTKNANGTPNTSSPARHVNGDLLFVANFSSGVATITSYTWNNGTIPSTGTTLPSTTATAAVNTVALDGLSGRPAPVPWPFRSSTGTVVQAGGFFEAGVDLNLLFPGQTNFNYSTFVVETRASTSVSATLSDFILGYVSTAPDVQVTKVADSATADAGGQVGYTVTLENVGVGDVNGVTLTDALPTSINWSIAAGGNPSGQFVLGGAPGAQTLSVTPGLVLPNASDPISVHIIGTTTSPGTLSNTATVAAQNEDAAFLGNNQASATITVSSSGVSTVSPQSAVEWTSHDFQMGSFDSASGGAATLVVSWGDGSPNTTVNFTKAANTTFNFADLAHTYKEQGTYTVTETVTVGSVIKTGSFIANVSNPSVIATAANKITKVYDGLAFGTKTLGTFTDPGGAEAVPGTSYSADITWGSGFPSSGGTITFSGTLDSKTDAFTITGSAPYKDVGNYSATVTINHEDSTPQQISVLFEVTQPTLTITADSAPNTGANDAFSKAYDGQVYSGFTVRYDGFVNGETFAVLGGTLGFTGEGTTAVNAGGPYTVTPNGLTSSNYQIQFVAGTLNITTVPLSITADADTGTAAVEAFSKQYDGQVFSPFTVRYAGFVNNEDPSVLSGTLGFTGAGATAVNAGGPYTVIPGGLTSNNYAIAFNNGSLTITKAPLTVTASSPTFNEGTNPSGLSASYSGFVNGETLATSGVTGSPSVTTDATNASAPGGSYAVTVTQGTLASNNYSFEFQNGTLTVVDVSPVIAMSAGAITLNLGDSFTRPSSFTDVGSLVPTETWTITVNYGDGTSTGPTTVADPGSIPVGHTYQTTGTFTVTVTVEDNYGAAPAVKTFTVTINP